MIPVWPERSIPAINTALLDLLECACDAVTVLGQGSPCWCGVYPGEAVSWDYCSEDECGGGNCGMVYIRPSVSFPYEVFPIPAVEADCVLPFAHEFELGVLRCFPVEVDGELPDAETVTEHAMLLAEDQQALLAALLCCEGPNLKSIVVSEWTPLGPNGACVGGYWTAIIDPTAR